MKHILLIVGIVLLLRLPFLMQPIQGDDPSYLFEAQHALIDPLHPSHTSYVFQGVPVDMRGHPHPTLNAWMLAGLLALFGDVNEAAFHAAYMVFSIIAALSMWSLAKRFSVWPLGATLLFLSVPTFIVNGTSLETDLPFLAFWLAGFAFFVSSKWIPAATALALAALTSYQAIFATPILALYCWRYMRQSRAAWMAVLTPVIVVGVYQAYERTTGGDLPATVLAGYLSTYGLQKLTSKLQNAAALTTHLGWIVFPALAAWRFRKEWIFGLAALLAGFAIDPGMMLCFAIGVMVLAGCWRFRTEFAAWWVLIFFAGALAVFFAGSARYLLPVAAPLAILCARERRWVLPAFSCNILIGLALAWTNYQHWDAYRQLADEIRQEVGERRVWINGEWGLRYYLEAEGALPLLRTQTVQPGEWIVSSELGYSFPVNAPTAPVIRREVWPTLPLRLIGLNARSGYSTAAMGLRPFDITTFPIDRVRVEAVLERKPVLSRLPMNAPEASIQLVSGVYQLEDKWRWTSDRAILLLKPPLSPTPLEVKFYVPGNAKARRIKISVDNQVVQEQAIPGEGSYTVSTQPISGSSVTIEVDKTFSPPGDSRRLGVILNEVGYR